MPKKSRKSPATNDSPLDKPSATKPKLRKIKERARDPKPIKANTFGPIKPVVSTSTRTQVNLSASQVESLLLHIADAQPLSSWVKKHGFTYSSIWLILDRNEVLYHKYVRAREIATELMAERLLTVQDDCPDPQRAKILSDNLKWLMAKNYMRRFSDKLQVEQKVTHSADASLLADIRGIKGIKSVVELPSDKAELCTGFIADSPPDADNE